MSDAAKLSSESASPVISTSNAATPVDADKKRTEAEQEVRRKKV
jgi:hypothetical protein